MTAARVFQVFLETGSSLLLAASGPHHLEVLLRSYRLQEEVIEVRELGRVANLQLAEAHPADT